MKLVMQAMHMSGDGNDPYKVSPVPRPMMERQVEAGNWLNPRLGSMKAA